MTKEEFKSLDQTDREKEIINHGFHLTNFAQGDFTCDLYRLHDFFVKFWYDSRGKESPKIITFAIFDDPNALEHHFVQLSCIS